MMQKFGFHTRRREQPPTPAPGGGSSVDMYGTRRFEEAKMQDGEKWKLEQKRAYYYQMVPTPCLDENEELRLDGKLKNFNQPRRTASESVAVSGTRLNSFVETMAFSRKYSSGNEFLAWT